MSKLSKADQWLINEINEKLQEKYTLSREEVDECIRNSSMMQMLFSNPEFVHHEDLLSWVITIAKQNKITNRSQAVYN